MPVTVAPVIVEDYSKDGTYHALDLSSGGVRVAENGPPQGFGQWRTFGLARGRRRTFVAVFVRPDDLVLWVGGHEHGLLRPGLAACLDDIAPFVARRFRLTAAGKVLFEAPYWFWQSSEWPDDGDIFSLVSRIVESPETGRGFLSVWKARAEGRDIGSQDFLRELQNALDARKR
jgi:hypothetical protein